MSILKKILIVLLVVLIILQFIPVDRSVPSDIDPKNDLIEITNPDQEIVQMLRTACYDCHSYQTEYPWYAYTAPAKWFLQDHVLEGREHFNFSQWGTYPKEDRREIAEEAQEEIEEGHMPLASYLWMHADAKLDDQQKNQLINYFHHIEEGY